MLINITKNGYVEMWESILEDTKFDKNDFRTYHLLTKNCPKISCLSIIPPNCHSNDVKFPVALNSNSLLQNILPTYIMVS